MTETLAPCQYVIDIWGLREIANSGSDNFKALCFDYLAKGIIGVPACVWKEFEDLYEELAEMLGPHIARKIRLKSNYHTAVASLADKIKLGFPLSPYDDNSDLYSAAICWMDGQKLLTAQEQLPSYGVMNCCEVVDLKTWADNEGV